MDTMFTPRNYTEKMATGVAGISIAFFLLLISNLSIQAGSITNMTGFSPNLLGLKDENIYKEFVFEQEIIKKYRNLQIQSVQKGVKHVRMIKYYNGKPVRINVIELSKNINPYLSIEPSIASNTLSNKTKISHIASREHAIVAINGGYFKPQTGVPLGTLMINKKVLTGPIYNRVALGISKDGFDMARVQMHSNFLTNKGGFKIDNINQPRMLSTNTIVYTPEWGDVSPSTPKYGAQLVVENNKIVRFSEVPVIIPQKGYVIVGPKKILESVKFAKRCKLDIKINPEWKNVNHIISGGPYLVKQGEVFVDMQAQKLNSIGGRNPRTAIGYTKDNNLIMLTADGREGASVGLTLIELAKLMKDLGCVYAMNLDGGGSTVMYVNGSIVNKPSVKGGIPLSNTLVVKNLN